MSLLATGVARRLIAAGARWRDPGRWGRRWVTSKAATAPMTRTAGEATSAEPSSASVQRPTTWPSVVADCTAATGVRGSRPPAISSAAMVARWETPIRITIVPPTLASERQSMSCSPARRWPVTTVNAADTPRWVMGMPAAAGAAIADVIPGTISKGTPAAARASASSPPRPKTNGSPPLRRTTRFAGSRVRRGAPRCLCCGVGSTRSLADVDQFDRLGDQRQHAVADEGIVDDDLGLGQQPRGLDRQQIRIARTAPTRTPSPPDHPETRLRRILDAPVRPKSDANGGGRAHQATASAAALARARRPVAAGRRLGARPSPVRRPSHRSHRWSVRP